MTSCFFLIFFLPKCLPFMAIMHPSGWVQDKFWGYIVFVMFFLMSRKAAPNLSFWTKIGSSFCPKGKFWGFFGTWVFAKMLKKCLLYVSQPPKGCDDGHDYFEETTLKVRSKQLCITLNIFIEMLCHLTQPIQPPNLADDPCSSLEELALGGLNLVKGKFQVYLTC